MKKLLLLGILAMIIASCSSKQEKMLHDYVDNNLKESINVKADDVDFKVNSIEKVKTITAKDSLDILVPYLEKKTKEKIEYLQEQIDEEENNIAKYKKDIENTKDKYSIEWNERYIKTALKSIDSYKNFIKIYQTNYKETFLEPTYKRIEEYKKLGNDAVLTNIYNVSFSFKNPMMNNVKQTIDETLYTNRDNTKFLGEVKEDK